MAAEILIDFLKQKLCDGDEYYKKDLIGYTLSAVLCQLLIDARRENSDDRFRCSDESAGRTEVFKRFVKEVAKDNGRHRLLSYYAERLCYTPIYIYICVKEVSGRTALNWITEHTMELINSD
ncbi:MAG: hypothetical protein IJZ86_02675 [Bacteroides sp.]|nr:hypothetical protein [Bacteroides sp.]